MELSLHLPIGCLSMQEVLCLAELSTGMLSDIGRTAEGLSLLYSCRTGSVEAMMLEFVLLANRYSCSAAVK